MFCNLVVDVWATIVWFHAKKISKRHLLGLHSSCHLVPTYIPTCAHIAYTQIPSQILQLTGDKYPPNIFFLDEPAWSWSEYFCRTSTVAAELESRLGKSVQMFIFRMISSGCLMCKYTILSGRSPQVTSLSPGISSPTSRHQPAKAWTKGEFSTRLDVCSVCQFSP